MGVALIWVRLLPETCSNLNYSMIFLTQLKHCCLNLHHISGFTLSSLMLIISPKSSFLKKPNSKVWASGTVLQR